MRSDGQASSGSWERGAGVPAATFGPLNVIKTYHTILKACRITGSIIAIEPKRWRENTRNISEMILIDRRTQFCSNRTQFCSKKSILSRGPYSKIMPIFWKRLASGFAVAALFGAFARSLGFDWVPTKASQDAGRGSEALRDSERQADKAADIIYQRIKISRPRKPTCDRIKNGPGLPRCAPARGRAQGRSWEALPPSNFSALGPDAL
jgi:hypothetical protein